MLSLKNVKSPDSNFVNFPKVGAYGAVPPCAVWYGGSPVSLDGAQAEKAIPGSADAGTKLNSTW